MAVCVPDYDPEGASLEIPEWMFDKAHCSQMHLNTQPRVCWMALAELSSLIEQTACQSLHDKVKDQHRFFQFEGGADDGQESIPATGATKPVSSSPKVAPMETHAQQGSPRCDRPTGANVVRSSPKGSPCSKEGGGRR